MGGTEKSRAYFIGLALFVLTVALYWPITKNPFILLDDEQYVTGNAHVTSGLNGTNFVWAFKNTEAANWHPLTWLSHQLDCTLFGLKAGWHHFENLLFHAANTVLLFIFLLRATGALWRAALVAAFFAWHPLHVESVAWASERKDVLSTFFWLLTLLAWLKYCRRTGILPVQLQTASDQSRNNQWFYYILSVFLFILGLLSKPMVVTLPFVLLLLDFWPLGRLRFNSADAIPLKFLIVEKLPFFALTAGGCAVTYLAQASGGAVWGMSLSDRLANAIVSYVQYILKIFCPADLAIIYSPPGHWPLTTVLGALAVLVLCTALALLQWRRRPYILMGWLWFLGTLVPTIGLVQVGAQSMADRYTYIPSIGFFIALIWSVAGVVEFRPAWKFSSLILVQAAMAACVVLTVVQIGYWNSNLSLFQHAVVVSPDSYVAANCLGQAYKQVGDKSDALRAYGKAVELEPRYPQSQYNYALGLFDAGQEEAALVHLQAAAVVEKRDPYIQHSLGLIFARHNSFTNALNCFSNQIVIQPASAEAHFDLASTLANLGQFKPAASQFQEALRLRPDYPDAKAQYGHLLNDHSELR